MKKYMGVATLLLIAMVVVSCSPNSPPVTDTIDRSESVGEQRTEEPTDDPEASFDDLAKSKLSQIYIDMFEEERFTMKYITIIDIDGIETTVEVTQAVADNMVATTMKYDGMESTTIIKDDSVHFISHDERTILTMPGIMDMEDELISPDELGDYTMEYIASGTDEFLGNMRDYEEYIMEDGSIRYYFNGDELVGMVISTDEEVTTMFIEEMSNEVDDNIFQLPEGYEKINTGF